MKNTLYLLIIIFVLLLSGGLLSWRLTKSASDSRYLKETGLAFSQVLDFIKSLPKTLEEEAQKSIQEASPSSTAKNKLYTPTTNSKPKATSKTKFKSTININGKTVYDSDDIQPDEVDLDKINNQPLIPSRNQKSCYRFTVPHLDGSSSSLCYSQSDYNQLATLYSQYSSAKANYDFELRVAKMYEDPRSDFFQKSADEASRKAQEWKDKMGEIALKMYNIESRGY